MSTFCCQKLTDNIASQLSSPEPPVSLGPKGLALSKEAARSFP